MSQELEHLKLLSIFHYVVGGMAAMFSLFPVLYLVLGIAMVTGGFASERPDPGAAAFGFILIGFAAAVILLGLAFAACLVVAGRSLARRTRYHFCLVMAGIECMFMPFGTVLGAFTIIVLVRDSVRCLFHKETAQHGTTG